jgi:hypothetical protein
VVSKPDKVDAREATKADVILTKLSNEMLKAMFVVMNKRGSSGAPWQSKRARIAYTSLNDSHCLY